MAGGHAFASAAFCGEGGTVDGTAFAGAALAGGTGLGFAGATVPVEGAFWGPGRASRPNAAAAPIADRATMARSRRMKSPIPRRASSGENPAVLRVQRPRTERR